MQVLFEGWTLASDGFLGSTAVHRVASGVWADLTRDSCSNVEGGEEDEANHNQLLRTAVSHQQVVESLVIEVFPLQGLVTHYNAL